MPDTTPKKKLQVFVSSTFDDLKVRFGQKLYRARVRIRAKTKEAGVRGSH
jgi:hypothetical protein